MRFKSYMVAGFVALSLSAGGALYQNAYATNSSAKTDTAIVLAQNNNDKSGFFSRIFNRSKDKNSAAKPLFLDGSQPSSNVKPYDFSRSRDDIINRRRSNATDVDWEAFVQAREAKIERNTQFAMAAAEAFIKESNKELAQIRQEQEEAAAVENTSVKNNDKKAGKKMVYDPERAWTYNPNKSRQSSKPASKIYNTSR